MHKYINKYHIYIYIYIYIMIPNNIFVINTSKCYGIDCGIDCSVSMLLLFINI